MPAKKRKSASAKAPRVYESTVPEPQQQAFPGRRRTVRMTAQSSGSAKSGKNNTLTQMDWVSSLHSEAELGTLSLEQEEMASDYDKEEVKSAKRRKSTAGGKKKVKEEERRRTIGDAQTEDAKPSRKKRRKTLGDTPGSSQKTLTQLYPRDLPVKDSDDDDDEMMLIKETPTKPTRTKHTLEDINSNQGSRKLDSAKEHAQTKAETPKGRRIAEIPSSQSPATPMLAKYSPQHTLSPLHNKSAQQSGASPAVPKSASKLPANLVIEDSYGPTQSSPATSKAPSQGSFRTPRKIRFQLPEDKENLTPGRTKPKSPKAGTKTAPGRVALREIPDSDEDDDFDPEETEAETEPEDDQVAPEHGVGGTIQEKSEKPADQSVTTQKTAVEADGNFEIQEAVLNPAENLDKPAEAAPVSKDFVDAEAATAVASMKSLGHETSGIPTTPARHSRDASDTSTLSVAEMTPTFLVDSHETWAERPITHEENPSSSEPRLPDQTLKSTFPEPSTTDHDRPPSPHIYKEKYTQAFTQGYTQGQESQRVPIEVIDTTGEVTQNSDIVISLYGDNMDRILQRTKTHEFRGWQIPESVHRVWIYLTKPASELKYMCVLGPAKRPGEIPEDGVGNAEFNAGKKASAKYAYEVQQVFVLNNPVALDVLRKNGWPHAPQKFAYVPPAIVGQLTANLRCSLFSVEAEDRYLASSPGVTISQELEQQIQSDIVHATQRPPEHDEVIPASQTPTRVPVTTASNEYANDFARPTRPASAGHHPFSNRGPRRNLVPLSQATTASQVSTSSVIASPDKFLAMPTHPSSPLEASMEQESSAAGSSPAMQRKQFPSSSQLRTRSQMLPHSLLDETDQEPPPIVWDSADEDGE